MHHIALNGPWPDNGYFNHQIVKGARPQAGQHRHLCPAFNLKHPNRIRRADHVIHSGILSRDVCQIQMHPIICAQTVQGTRDASQHAQGQHINLQNTQRVQIILVPLHKGAVWHGGIANGHQFVQRAARNDKAANMLG